MMTVTGVVLSAYWNLIDTIMINYYNTFVRKKFGRAHVVNRHLKIADW